MATVINNPTTDTTPRDSGSGFMIGIILLILFIILFFFYGLPYLRVMGGGTSVNVPGRIDVNLHTTK